MSETSDSRLHFAADPENLLCGRFAIETLCGLQRQNTTNWNVEQVTCTRCLEVMEERATGIKVTQVHDEVIVEATPSEVNAFWDQQPYKPAAHDDVFDMKTWHQKMGEALKRRGVMEKLLQQQRAHEEMLARVKKKFQQR